MVKSLNKDVLAVVDEIVLHIKNTDNYKKYKLLEEKMMQDKDIMERVNMVKKLQKEIVKLEYEKKDITSKEKEIEQLLRELDNYPIYQEYNYLLEDLNNLFQEIKLVIEKLFVDAIN